MEFDNAGLLRIDHRQSFTMKLAVHVDERKGDILRPASTSIAAA